MRDLARHSSVFLHEMCGITLQSASFSFIEGISFLGFCHPTVSLFFIVNCYWIHFPNGWCVLCMSVILSSLARRGMTIAILQFAFIDSLRWHWTNIQLRQYLGSELTRDTPQVKVMDRPTNQQTDIGVPIAKKNADWKPKSLGFIIQLKQFGPKAQLKFTSLLQSSYHQYCFQSSLPICCLLSAFYLKNKVMPGEKTLFIWTCLVLYVPADWPDETNQWTLVETSCSVSLWVSMII